MMIPQDMALLCCLYLNFPLCRYRRSAKDNLTWGRFCWFSNELTRSTSNEPSRFSFRF
jgi:hypothetical protein